MAKSIASDSLARLSKICLALPETSSYRQAEHAGFLVRKKVFAYFLNNHHGDGIIGFTCKVLPGENTALIAAQPERFYMPAYVGPRGWLGVRLDRGKVDWKEVAELVAISYRLVAPPKLAALVTIEE